MADDRGAMERQQAVKSKRLEDLLGRRVDVVTEAAISPHIHDAVIKAAIRL